MSLAPDSFCVVSHLDPSAVFTLPSRFGSWLVTTKICGLRFLGRPVRNNSWTHVAVTWEDVNRTMSIFIDGVLILKKSENTDSRMRKQIGHDYWLGWRSNRENMAYRGLMRDLQIFNKVLSQSELQYIKGKY